MNSSPSLARPSAGLLSMLPLVLGLSACTALDPYADKFDRVAVGDSRASVLSTMGTPSSSSSLQVPMVSLDSMTWRAPLNCKLYIVVVAMDRVVAKSAIQ